MLPLTSLLPKFASLIITLLMVPYSLLAVDFQHIFLLTNGKNYTEIPFTLVNNLIVVEVVVAGERPMNFILDNGTSNPVIFHKSYLRGLSLTYGRNISFQGAGKRRSVQAKMITGTSLHLSGAATDRIGMIVLNKNPFHQLKGSSKTIHGVLGSTLFRSFIVEIDYPNRILRLHQHRTFSAQKHYQAVPMRIVNGKPYLSALVQGKITTMEMDLLFDLGFNNSLLLQLSDSMARKMITNPVATRIGVGYSGGITGRKGSVLSVVIGPSYYEEVATVVPSARSLPLEEPSSGIHRMGSIGNTMFKNTSIVINYPDERFYISCSETLLAEQMEESMCISPIDQNTLVF